MEKLLEFGYEKEKNLFLDCPNKGKLTDVFVGSLKLSEFGFKVDHTEIGRPAYHPADLLKLYIRL